MAHPVDRCDFQVGELIDHRFTVHKILGEGSFGKVYLVLDPQGRRHALKILRLWEVTPDIRKELESRFDLEFKTGQIACENLVQSEEYGDVGGNPFILMEFCSGGDMTPLLGNARGREARICQQILNGLRALHINGKVHRDLKPENVLFKDGDIAALTDFGIAGDRNHRMTSRNIFGRPDQMFGTYAYMAPEQFNRARGNATVLPTTDIYSFGVLAFQLLTGELPFGKLENHNDLAEYQKHSKDNVWNRHLLQNIPDSRAWFQVIERCIDPDFHKRAQSASDVLALLPAPRKPEPIRPMPSPKWYSPSPSPRPVSKPTSVANPMPRPRLAVSSPVSSSPILRVMQGDEYGRTFNLMDIIRKNQRHIITIGRDAANDVHILCERSYYVSRHHCTIEHNPKGDKWIVRDGQWDRRKGTWNESANGTYVNSAEANLMGLKLHHGDIITMGDVTLRFENN